MNIFTYRALRRHAKDKNTVVEKSQQDDKTVVAAWNGGSFTISKTEYYKWNEFFDKLFTFYRYEITLNKTMGRKVKSVFNSRPESIWNILTKRLNENVK
ncbi:MAG: hypothetical protein FWF97_02115 [Alphaproteobacteria bacterium]|nr:hypothetical protein [Alphaproteobacteria bacterium]